jgi:hypothetical protein
MLALWIHVLLLPWWLFCWALPAGLVAADTRQPVTTLRGLSIAVWLALGVYAVGAAIWIKLLTDLVRWGREGRDVTWKYPARWAAWTMLSIYFAVAFLFPGVRRGLAPLPRSQKSSYIPIEPS